MTAASQSVAPVALLASPSSQMVLAVADSPNTGNPHRCHATDLHSERLPWDLAEVHRSFLKRSWLKWTTLQMSLASPTFCDRKMSFFSFLGNTV